MSTNIRVTLDMNDNDIINIANLALSSTGIVYFGGTTTEGSWRLVRSGDDLKVQRYESSVWVDKGGFGA